VHPNIGQIYEFGQTEDDEPYIAMQLVPAPSLADKFGTAVGSRGVRLERYGRPRPCRGSRRRHRSPRHQGTRIEPLVDDDSIVSPHQDGISEVVNGETVPLMPGVDHSITATHGPPPRRPSKLSINAKRKRDSKKAICISGIQRTSQVRRSPNWVAIGDNLLVLRTRRFESKK
jgi:hypothetical protein